MTRRYATLLPIVVLVTLLAACSTAGQRGNNGPATTSPPSSSPATRGPSGRPPSVHSSPGDLAAAKKKAKIAGCPSSDRDVSPRSKGLPDLRLPCLGGGKSVRLAGLRKKPMLITIWAAWCIPCRQEAPYLAQADRRAGNKLGVLGIDYNDPLPADAIAFARHYDWRFGQVQDRHKKIAEKLHVPGPPITLLVDEHGKIVHRNVGPFRSFDQLKSSVDEHLGVTL